MCSSNMNRGVAQGQVNESAERADIMGVPYHQVDSHQALLYL